MEFLSKLNYPRGRYLSKLRPPQDAEEMAVGQAHPKESSSSSPLAKVKPSVEEDNSGRSDAVQALASEASARGPLSKEIRIIMNDNVGLVPPASIMRFTNTDVNPETWKMCKMVREKRKNGENSEATVSGENYQGTGAGSEYGAKAREEAKQQKRMRKYRKKETKREDQPWLLKASTGKEIRRYRGVKEGGVSAHASYFIFAAKQEEDEMIYQAYPVQNWFDFKTVPRPGNLMSAEEAEEKFEKRNEIYNYFSLITRKRMGITDENNEEEEDSAEKKKRKQTANDHCDNDFSSSEDEMENGKKARKEKRGKNDLFVNDNDENYEGEMEVDYMSSSETSCSELDEAEGENESGRDKGKDFLNSTQSDSDEEKTTGTITVCSDDAEDPAQS